MRRIAAEFYRVCVPCGEVETKNRKFELIHMTLLIPGDARV